MTQPEGFGDILARMQLRKQAATAQGGQAFARLLDLAESHHSGQARRIAQFIASTYDGAAFPFDLFELRIVDEAIGEDMLARLDALRWGQSDLYQLVPNGEPRVRPVIDLWGLRPRTDE